MVKYKNKRMRSANIIQDDFTNAQWILEYRTICNHVISSKIAGFAIHINSALKPCLYLADNHYLLVIRPDRNWSAKRLDQDGRSSEPAYIVFVIYINIQLYVYNFVCLVLNLNLISVTTRNKNISVLIWTMHNYDNGGG